MSLKKKNTTAITLKSTYIQEHKHRSIKHITVRISIIYYSMNA